MPSSSVAVDVSGEAMTTLGWTARRIAAAVNAGEVTAETVLGAHLEAIAGAEDTLHAWALIDGEGARAGARRVDAANGCAGPLAGVPVGVKDIIDVAGMPTSNGAPAISASPAVRDAAAVARLRTAGAVIIGKTVTAEYALHQPGPTVNPHDHTRTPGGSSSGSAAATAAGQVPLALGTQTAGSIVRPAAFCGVVGGKPTRHRVPRDGVTPSSPSLDTVGVLGVDVEDVALALGVMADDVGGYVPAAPPARIGFCRGFEWEEIDPACRTAIEDAVERLGSAFDVVEVSMPAQMHGLASSHRVISGVESADSLREVRRRHGGLLSEATHRAARAGDRERWAYTAAWEHVLRARAHLPKLFVDADVLITPAVLGEAPPVSSTGDPLLCRPWTALEVPTVAIPGISGPSGLPLGVQIVADAGRDATALGAASCAIAALYPSDDS